MVGGGKYLAETMDAEITVRPMESIEEYRAAQQIMGQTWGFHDDDVVALPTLIATAHAGGLICGAFEGSRMVGLSYAFVGRMDGEHLLYSQMTAVAPGDRGRGIGMRIKWYQRLWAIERGYERIRWTFDPLMEPNARFNLRYLGAWGIRYLVDFYGRSPSPLHGSLPTDRFIADWELNAPRTIALANGEDAPVLEGANRDLPVIYTLAARPSGPVVPTAATVPDPASEPYAIAPIPSRFLEMQVEEPDAAEAWRLGTRDAFQQALAAGYRFVDFVNIERDPEAAPPWCYLLARI
jgi:predicted GNAT superfamily acetyltransferase